MFDDNTFTNSIRAEVGTEEEIAAWRSERNERWKRESIENGMREESKEEEKTSIIKSMLNAKLDYDFISKITGKTIKEIKEIENNM